MVYEKSDLISMESEDLYISLRETKVKYIFKNDSDQAVKGLMVFPLPPFDPGNNFEQGIYPVETDGSIDHEEIKRNPLKFSVRVNGKTKAFKTEAKKTGEFEVTIKYFWEQVFPPKSQIVVEHSYLTNAGSGYAMGRGSDPSATYCYDEAFKRALDSLTAPAKEKFRSTPPETNTYKVEDDYVRTSLHYAARHVGYIFKTGANWKGPIKNFKLTLDKGKPENLLSVCWEGFRQEGQTKFISEKTNYTPDQDLSVLIIEKSKFKLF